MELPNFRIGMRSSIPRAEEEEMNKQEGAVSMLMLQFENSDGMKRESRQTPPPTQYTCKSYRMFEPTNTKTAKEVSIPMEDTPRTSGNPMHYLPIAISIGTVGTSCFGRFR